VDALDEDTLKEQAARLERAAKRAPLLLSSASGQGVQDALRSLAEVVDRERAAETPVPAEALSGWRP
jgi:GTP-binding protein